MPQLAPPKLMSVDDLVETLGTTRRFVYRLSSQGRIRTIKVGGQLRFDPADVNAYIERAATGMDRPQPAGSGRPKPRRRVGRPRKSEQLTP